MTVKLVISTILKTGCLAAALMVAVVRPAEAQMTWTDQGFVNVNFGVQGGSRDITTTSNFELYGENATISTAQEAGGGAFFDFGGGYKVWRNLALGITYSRNGSSSDAAINGTVPDPNFFDRLRPVSGTAADLEYAENAFHLQGTWMMPVTDKVDVGLSFGPTIFNVSQDIPTAITISEPGPTISSTTITREKKSTLGINFGVDVNYLITPRFGAGVLLRYSWGSVDFDPADDSLTVGGFQFGGGLRVRF